MRHRLRAAGDGAKTPPDRDPRLTAMRLLARRDFAAAELSERLQADGHPPESVAAVIAELSSGRLLDDARFAEHYVAHHAQRGHGPRRIAQELSQRGVAQTHIQAALTQGVDWGALAREVRVRRFGPEVPEAWSEKARQGRFLQYRGFSSDHIRQALGPDFESEEPS